MTAHSKLGASISERWMNCPGSIQLSEGLPSKVSFFADEGTEAHDQAAHRLTKGHWRKDISDEMKDAVQVYVDYVVQLASSVRAAFGNEPNGIDSGIWIEQKFDLSSVYPGCFGTADCVIYDAATRTLHVIDYKHGAGVAVDVVKGGKPNTQLMYYGLGALIQGKFPCRTVCLTIVQPRCPHPAGHIRSLELPASDMLSFAADLAELASRTEKPNAELMPGEYCRWCPASAICPALKDKAMAAAQKDFSPAAKFSPEELAGYLEIIPKVEAWIQGVRSLAYTQAERGQCPPGWKLVAKRATRKWKDPDGAARALELKAKVDGDKLYHPPELKSPAQIEKLLTKDQKALLAELVVAESSGYNLVPESHPGEPIKKDAASQFEAIETTGRPVHPALEMLS